MSTRLQVVMDDAELAQIRAVAARQGMTVSEWVRQVIRAARRQEADGDVGRKLAAIEKAMQYSFPTADIDVMIAQTTQGYLVDGE